MFNPIKRATVACLFVHAHIVLTLLTYGKIKARIETLDGVVAHFLGRRNDISGILFLAAKIPAIKPERMLTSRMNQVPLLD